MSADKNKKKDKKIKFRPAAYNLSRLVHICATHLFSLKHELKNTMNALSTWMHFIDTLVNCIKRVCIKMLYHYSNERLTQPCLHLQDRQTAKRFNKIARYIFIAYFFFSFETKTPSLCGCFRCVWLWLYAPHHAWNLSSFAELAWLLFLFHFPIFFEFFLSSSFLSISSFITERRSAAECQSARVLKCQCVECEFHYNFSRANTVLHR